MQDTGGISENQLLTIIERGDKAARIIQAGDALEYFAVMRAEILESMVSNTEIGDVAALQEHLALAKAFHVAIKRIRRDAERGQAAREEHTKLFNRK